MHSHATIATALLLLSTGQYQFSACFTISPAFAKYDDGTGTAQAIPAWVITNGSSGGSVHRFFDTSPISPSGRYVAVTRLPVEEGSRLSTPPPLADVVVYYLAAADGPSAGKVVARTAAWDLQVGAHVQWGTTDARLYYNVLDGNGTSVAVRGVQLDLATGAARHLECAVYQLSPDERHAIAPDLTKIAHTQYGYGVRVGAVARRNRGAPSDDGLYLTDVATGRCRLLVSLKTLADAGRLNPDVPTYGFHAKWSSDGARVMFVVRTLEAPRGQWPWPWQWPWHGRQPVRRQHLFVLDTSSLLAGAVPAATAGDAGAVGANVRPPRLLVSWDSGVPLVGGPLAARLDGNHPNWVPHSHRISMNLRVKLENHEEERRRRLWHVVVVDADLPLPDPFLQSLATHAGTRQRRPASASATNATAAAAFYPGSGHPSVHGGGRVVLSDAYLKEPPALRRREALRAARTNRSRDVGEAPGAVALRLLDLALGREVRLLLVPVAGPEAARGSPDKARPADLVTAAGQMVRSWAGRSGATKKETHAWRCDPHPAWSRDYRWITFAGRPNGGPRQVMVAYIGPHPDRFFRKREQMVV
jgi:hypothetical protein